MIIFPFSPVATPMPTFSLSFHTIWVKWPTRETFHVIIVVQGALQLTDLSISRCCNWPKLHNIQCIRKRESIYCVILCNLRKKHCTTMIVVLCNLEQFSAICYTSCLFGQLTHRLIAPATVVQDRKHNCSLALTLAELVLAFQIAAYFRFNIFFTKFSCFLILQVF